MFPLHMACNYVCGDVGVYTFLCPTRAYIIKCEYCTGEQ